MQGILSYSVEGKKFQFGQMKKFQKWTVVMAVQPWESTQRHSELLEVGSFILHTFSHNLFFFKQKDLFGNGVWRH